MLKTHTRKKIHRAESIFGPTERRWEAAHPLGFGPVAGEGEAGRGALGRPAWFGRGKVIALARMTRGRCGVLLFSTGKRAAAMWDLAAGSVKQTAGMAALRNPESGRMRRGRRGSSVAFGSKREKPSGLVSCRIEAEAAETMVPGDHGGGVPWAVALHGSCREAR